MRGDGSWTAFGHTAGHTSNDGNVCPHGTRCGAEFDDSPRSRRGADSFRLASVFMPQRKPRASDNSIPCCESPPIICCACGATAERRVLRQPCPSFTAMSKRVPRRVASGGTSKRRCWRCDPRNGDHRRRRFAGKNARTRHPTHSLPVRDLIAPTPRWGSGEFHGPAQRVSPLWFRRRPVIGG